MTVAIDARAEPFVAVDDRRRCRQHDLRSALAAPLLTTFAASVLGAATIRLHGNLSARNLAVVEFGIARRLAGVVSALLHALVVYVLALDGAVFADDSNVAAASGSDGRHDQERGGTVQLQFELLHAVKPFTSSQAIGAATQAADALYSMVLSARVRRRAPMEAPPTAHPRARIQVPNHDHDMPTIDAFIVR